ncbi:MAG TPA: PQQ-binding-like beta-propeller repeat protein [Gemmatimonadales bacterium]|nr:PQQ-binding-like beta-propeller repeat protein [Gemmatimonadales bacterium]
MSRNRGALSLALLLGSVNAACVNFRPPPAPITPAVAGDAPTPVWTARAGRRLSGHVEIRDSTLYGGGTDRKVYAVDLASGEVRWSVRLSGMVVGGVLLSGDTIYAASSRPEGRIYALRRGNGKQIWRTAAHPIGAPLALVDGVLVAETQRGEVLALNPASGKVLWHRRVGAARVGAAPAGHGGVLVATTDSLFRLALADGRVTHRSASPGTVVSPWLSHNGALIGGTTDSQVVSIRPSDLHRNWTLQVDAPVLTSPAAMGDTLVLATRIGTVYRINPDSVAAKKVIALDWPVTAPVAIVRSEILLGGADGMIRALRANGSEIWRVRVWRPVELSPIPLSDGLLAIGGNGDLHRYRR